MRVKKIMDETREDFYRSKGWKLKILSDVETQRNSRCMFFYTPQAGSHRVVGHLVGLSVLKKFVNCFCNCVTMEF